MMKIINEAIRELFERLGRSPPAVPIAVGCIDDLIDTDLRYSLDLK